VPASAPATRMNRKSERAPLKIVNPQPNPQFDPS
jgi:hypothetical protein